MSRRHTSVSLEFGQYRNVSNKGTAQTSLVNVSANWRRLMSYDQSKTRRAVTWWRFTQSINAIQQLVEGLISLERWQQSHHEFGWSSLVGGLTALLFINLLAIWALNGDHLKTNMNTLKTISQCAFQDCSSAKALLMVSLEQLS